MRSLQGAMSLCPALEDTAVTVRKGCNALTVNRSSGRTSGLSRSTPQKSAISQMWSARVTDDPVCQSILLAVWRPSSGFAPFGCLLSVLPAVSPRATLEISTVEVYGQMDEEQPSPMCWG